MPFGFGKKKEPVADPNTSIDRLNGTLETIEKREVLLQKKIDQEITKAKEASKKGNKNLALSHLKRKKGYEEQLNKLGQQRSNIEGMQMKLEEATMNIEALNAQKAAANAIKGVYGKMTPDKIDDTMDSVRDAVDSANEISEAISQPMDNDIVDEDELLDELNELDQEDLDAQMMDLNSIGAPKVPQKPQKAETAEDDEDAMLAELTAQLEGA